MRRRRTTKIHRVAKYYTAGACNETFCGVLAGGPVQTTDLNAKVTCGTCERIIESRKGKYYGVRKLDDCRLWHALWLTRNGAQRFDTVTRDEAMTIEEVL